MNSRGIAAVSLRLAARACGAVVIVFFWGALLSASSSVDAILKEAAATNDPVRTVEILDRAIEDPSISRRGKSRLYFARGMALKKSGDCFRAIVDFNSALIGSPNPIPALLEKTHCMIVVDQTEEAGRALERILPVEPRNARAYILKGMIYESEGFPVKAADEFTRALYYDPSSAEALDARRRALLKLGKPREALEDAEALIGLKPKRAGAFIARARIHGKLKEYESALTDYERAEELGAPPDEIAKEKALVYFKTDRPKKALEALSDYSAERLYDPEGLVLKARAHILLSDFERAEKVLRRVLSINALYAPAYLFQGVAAVRRSRRDEALGFFDKAIRIDPSLVDAYKERSRLFMDLGDPVRAAADLTKAADLDPADGEIFDMRGLTYVERRLYNAAIEDFTRALECLPGDPRISYHRAVARYLLGEPDEALTDLPAALSRETFAPRALALRGVIRFRQGMTDQAKEDLDRAVEADPSDSTLWNNRGYLAYKLGDFDAAIRDFKKSLSIDPDYDKAAFNLQFALRKSQSASAGPEDAGGE